MAVKIRLIIFILLFGAGFAVERRYIREPNDPKCPGYNELYTECNVECDVRCDNLLSIDERMACKPEECKPGCVCSTGSARNIDNICVPTDMCDGPAHNFWASGKGRTRNVPPVDMIQSGLYIMYDPWWESPHSWNDDGHIDRKRLRYDYDDDDNDRKKLRDDYDDDDNDRKKLRDDYDDDDNDRKKLRYANGYINHKKLRRDDDKAIPPWWEGGILRHNRGHNDRKKLRHEELENVPPWWAEGKLRNKPADHDDIPPWWGEGILRKDRGPNYRKRSRLEELENVPPWWEGGILRNNRDHYDRKKWR